MDHTTARVTTSLRRLALPMFVLLALAAPAARAQVSAGAISAAKDNLRQILGESARSAELLRGLRASNDKDLLPLLTAMCQSNDRLRRLFAVLAVCDLAEGNAVEAMHQRFREDGDTGVRSVALNHLIQYHAVTDEEIQLALKSGDDNLGLMGAREALKRGQTQAAADVLKRIIADTQDAKPAAETNGQAADPSELADLSRMLLLSANQCERPEELAKLLTGNDTEPRIKLLLLGLVGKDSIQAAEPMVRKVIESPDLQAVRMEALRTLALLNPGEGAQAIAAELKKNDDPVCQVQLISVLTTLPGADKILYDFCQCDKPILMELSRFELARMAGKTDELQTSTLELMKTGHPILADFVVRRAKERPDEAYVQGLLLYIKSVASDQQEMGPEHARAASATAVLVKISSPAAEAGLMEILAGPYNSITRSVASGLVLAEGPCLGNVAAKILNSPYDELSTSATLALGKVGDARAAKNLSRIVQHSDRYPPGLCAIASWELLKVAGQNTQFARELAAKSK